MPPTGEFSLADAIRITTTTRPDFVIPAVPLSGDVGRHGFLVALPARPLVNESMARPLLSKTSFAKEPRPLNTRSAVINQLDRAAPYDKPSARRTRQKGTKATNKQEWKVTHQEWGMIMRKAHDTGKETVVFIFFFHTVFDSDELRKFFTNNSRLRAVIGDDLIKNHAQFADNFFPIGTVISNDNDADGDRDVDYARSGDHARCNWDGVMDERTPSPRASARSFGFRCSPSPGASSVSSVSSSASTSSNNYNGAGEFCDSRFSSAGSPSSSSYSFDDASPLSSYTPLPCQQPPQQQQVGGMNSPVSTPISSPMCSVTNSPSTRRLPSPSPAPSPLLAALTLQQLPQAPPQQQLQLQPQQQLQQLQQQHVAPNSLLGAPFDDIDRSILDDSVAFDEERGFDAFYDDPGALNNLMRLEPASSDFGAAIQPRLTTNTTCGSGSSHASIFGLGDPLSSD